MLLLIADDIPYNNRGGYFSDDNTTVMTREFRAQEDAYYAVLHRGGASMGDDTLYRISSDSTTLRLDSSMGLGGCAYFDGYVYYGKSEMAFGDTYRISIPLALAGSRIVVEKVAPDGYNYRGFCIDPQQRQVYGGGFLTEEFVAGYNRVGGTAWFNEPDAFQLYRLDLDTMQHVKISDRSYSFLQVVDDWLYYLENDELWRMRLDCTGNERAYPELPAIERYYIDGDSIVCLLRWDYVGEYNPIWQRTGIRR
jgi:hypothetical protein